MSEFDDILRELGAEDPAQPSYDAPETGLMSPSQGGSPGETRLGAMMRGWTPTQRRREHRISHEGGGHTTVLPEVRIEGTPEGQPQAAPERSAIGDFATGTTEGTGLGSILDRLSATDAADVTERRGRRHEREQEAYQAAADSGAPLGGLLSPYGAGFVTGQIAPMFIPGGGAAGAAGEAAATGTRLSRVAERALTHGGRAGGLGLLLGAAGSEGDTIGEIGADALRTGAMGFAMGAPLGAASRGLTAEEARAAAAQRAIAAVEGARALPSAETFERWGRRPGGIEGQAERIFGSGIITPTSTIEDILTAARQRHEESYSGSRETARAFEEAQGRIPIRELTESIRPLSEDAARVPALEESGIADALTGRAERRAGVLEREGGRGDADATRTAEQALAELLSGVRSRRDRLGEMAAESSPRVERSSGAVFDPVPDSPERAAQIGALLRAEEESRPARTAATRERWRGGPLAPESPADLSALLQSIEGPAEPPRMVSGHRHEPSMRDAVRAAAPDYARLVSETSPWGGGRTLGAEEAVSGDTVRPGRAREAAPAWSSADDETHRLLREMEEASESRIPLAEQRLEAARSEPTVSLGLLERELRELGRAPERVQASAGRPPMDAEWGQRERAALRAVADDVVGRTLGTPPEEMARQRAMTQTMGFAERAARRGASIAGQRAHSGGILQRLGIAALAEPAIAAVTSSPAGRLIGQTAVAEGLSRVRAARLATGPARAALEARAVAQAAERGDPILARWAPRLTSAAARGVLPLMHRTLAETDPDYAAAVESLISTEGEADPFARFGAPDSSDDPFARFGAPE